MRIPIALGAWVLLLGSHDAAGQQSPPKSQEAQTSIVSPRQDFGSSMFMQVPLSHLIPGAQPSRPSIRNPAQADPKSAARGMTYFVNFNCVGCHAANGGGGMGPSLSNKIFAYGSQPENIYLSIYQGRPNGMPAWGALLPDKVIWDLVTYIGKISNEPGQSWGRTFSREPLSPEIEQVPTEQVSTTDPWSSTKSFGFGRKP